MSGWGEGYVTDMRYIDAVQQDALPANLAAALTLRRRRAPDFSRPFRALDLGCGSGLTALGIAAANPQAEVVGVDFTPDHILEARDAVAAIGLRNARFEEASFADLLERPEALGVFDLVICHGVLSWISAENRARVVEILRRHTATGAMVFLGYNAMPGWAAAAPFRGLVTRLARTRAGADRVQAVGESYAALMRLAEAGVGHMAENALLKGWLATLTERPPEYLAHEYLPEDATAFWHDDIAAEMANARLQFAAAARLAENFDDFMIPEPMREILADAERRGCGETIRDFCANRTFRSDIFARGAPKLGEEAAQRAFAGLAIAAYTPADRPVEVRRSGQTPAPVDPALTRPTLALLEERPDSVGGLIERAAAAGLDRGAAAKTVIALMASGAAEPLATREPSAEAVAACAAFNRVAVAESWPALASPQLGGAASAGEIERAMLTGDDDPSADGEADETTREHRASRRALFDARRALFPAP